LTIVAGGDPRPWNDHPSREVVFYEQTAPLLAALNEEELDIERVILDGIGSPQAFLELLASLPATYAGDVLNIDDGGRAFLSATGRGGDRVLYALEPNDVSFYLELHGMTA
jgi:hypothetical protein